MEAWIEVNFSNSSKLKSIRVFKLHVLKAQYIVWDLFQVDQFSSCLNHYNTKYNMAEYQDTQFATK